MTSLDVTFPLIYILRIIEHVFQSTVYLYSVDMILCKNKTLIVLNTFYGFSDLDLIFVLSLKLRLRVSLGCFVCLSVGRSVGQSVSRSVGQSVSRSVA